jgi:phage protein U
MDDAQPQLLVIGQEVLGEFAIEEMEKVPEFAPDGSVRKLTVSLKLVEVRNDNALR